MDRAFFSLILKGHGNKDISLWLPLWMILLACGWLLPNHTPPWSSFHQDTWISMMFLFSGIAIVVPYQSRIHWVKPAIYGVIFAFIPWIQYLIGIIEYFGTAWIAFLYILGFSLAIQLGYNWQKNAPNQGLSLAFSALLFAGIFNSGIIFLQISNADISSYIPWVVEPMGPRPFGNFAQPNNMATFILLSIFSAIWLFKEKHIGQSILIILCVILFFALVATQSRSSLLALMAVGIFVYLRTEKIKRCTGIKRVSWFAIPLFTFVLMWMVPLVFGSHSDGSVENLVSRTFNEKRLDVYGIFLDAAIDRFWLGYGIDQGAIAQMHVALNHPGFEGFCFYAHNLFLDLLVWLGVPLGSMIGLMIVGLVYQLLSKTHNHHQMVLQCMTLVLMVHGMLELPLYYAFFLIPFGFLIGGLLEMQGVSPIISMSRRLWAVSLLMIVVSLVLTIQSYLGIEESYSVLRQKAARIQGANGIEIKSNHWLVNQFNDAQRVSANNFGVSLTDSELKRASKANLIYPNYHNLMLEAKGLAISGDIESAQTIVNKLFKVSTASNIKLFKEMWRIEANSHLNMRAVSWEYSE